VKLALTFSAPGAGLPSVLSKTTVGDDPESGAAKFFCGAGGTKPLKPNPCTPVSKVYEKDGATPPSVGVAPPEPEVAPPEPELAPPEPVLVPPEPVLAPPEPELAPPEPELAPPVPTLPPDPLPGDDSDGVQAPPKLTSPAITNHRVVKLFIGVSSLFPARRNMRAPPKRKLWKAGIT
jgi:hypothetical protein